MKKMKWSLFWNLLKSNVGMLTLFRLSCSGKVFVSLLNDYWLFWGALLLNSAPFTIVNLHQITQIEVYVDSYQFFQKHFPSFGLAMSNYVFISSSFQPSTTTTYFSIPLPTSLSIDFLLYNPSRIDFLFWNTTPVKCFSYLKVLMILQPFLDKGEKLLCTINSYVNSYEHNSHLRLCLSALPCFSQCDPSIS